MKQPKNKATPFTLAPLAAALPLLFSTQMAQANCIMSGTSTITYTCNGLQTNSTIDGQSTNTIIDATTSPSWDLNIYNFELQNNDLTGQSFITFTGKNVSASSEGAFGIKLTNNGNISTTLENSDIIASNTSGSSSGGIVIGYTSDNANPAAAIQTTTLINTNISTSNYAAAISMKNNGSVAGGSIKIDLTGGSIKSNGPDSTAKGAMISAAMSGFGGDIIITTAGGTIESGGTGISAQNRGTTGNILIDNDSTITATASDTTYNSSGFGIVAANYAANGEITLINKKNIKTTAESGDGLQATSYAGGKINITNTGTIEAGGLGIYAYTEAGGDVTINNTANIITPELTYGNGIYILNESTIKSDSSITTSGNIDSANTAIKIENNTAGKSTVKFNSGTINSLRGYGISVGASPYSSTNSNTGAVTIDTAVGTSIKALYVGINADNYGTLADNGTITITNNSAINSGEQGILAVNYADAPITITNHGTITSTSNHADKNAHGIDASATSGSITITNDAAITTLGVSASTINAEAKNKGNITITNAGTLTLSGASTASAPYGVNGILAVTAAGNANITHTGDILNTSDGIVQRGIFAQSTGIGADAGNAIIQASGNISVVTDLTTMTSVGNNHEGLQAQSRGGIAQVDYVAGNLTTAGGSVSSGFGITAWDRLSGETTSAVINVGKTGETANITAYGLSSIGIQAASKTNTITLGANTTVLAGGTGVILGFSTNLNNSTSSTLNNAGKIGALSDSAILVAMANNGGSSATINNTGTITGSINANDTALTLNNLSSNSWNIRNFADTDGDNVRDTKGISISNFGANPASIIKNEATGTIRLESSTAETTVNTANQYLGKDNLASYDINQAGVTQGQILNLARFENRGMIDLTGGTDLTGNMLIISGGITAGGKSNGVYVSDGGSVKMNVVLNEGGANTKSDLLVIDNAITGAGGATKLLVNAVGGAGATVAGDGIRLVEVTGTSSKDAFTLGNKVFAGPYEYALFQNSLTDQSDQSWFLRNYIATPTPSNGGGEGGETITPIYSAQVGSYLGNQSAAVDMFMHTLHDRIGEPQFTEANKADGNVPSAWMRVVTNKAENDAANGLFNQSTTTNLVQIGGELARWENSTNRLHFGLMGGYGQSTTDTDTNYDASTGVKNSSSEGKVTGYNFGAYATWYGNKDLPTGPYVDGWVQYATFDNKVNTPNLAQENYDSSVFTASIEGGYAFLVGETNNRLWMFEPQLQIAYNDYSADDHTDSMGMHINGDGASGLVTRVGARAYLKNKVGNAIQPFVEANWWHSDADNNLNFSSVGVSPVSISDDTPSDRFELKLGLQGEVAKDWQLWGHVGAQTGKDNYSRYEGMVGLKHIF